MQKIKVLIVDDSALVRQMLSEMLSSHPQIEVVGSANDPYMARDMIKQLHPDVLTLDIEMPKMDGISFLKNLMRLHPLPVVMVSTLTEHGAEVTLQALELGAIDFVTKPKINLVQTFEQYTQEICAKVLMASKVTRGTLERQYARFSSNLQSRPKVERLEPAPSVSEKYDADIILKKSTTLRPSRRGEKVIAIGASTGGTEAIKEVLMRLPASTPPIVISQHIPAAFSRPFAQRMDSVSELTVHEAKDNQPLLQGHVYIAPGDKHLLIEPVGGKYVCRLNDGPPVNRHKPSVDVMFRSVAQNVGSNAIGVILTGMGADGAKGLKEIQEMGAPTIAQDQKTSVVWGMPGEAVKLEAADQILPLDKIAHKILNLVNK
ncbi:chemotaxis response regulator protein-glutamate methylesterase [Thiomicrospira sp. R3]|uniref:protein-glutamate methylesterase/protein-glutamine glutaminase n=1 Tax=Thiomicrospira sp. R3 TaxID=3035472 RepID=UPI00259BA135|nr:chemotaxis response regulator protein-glutamate methylesterase [Thiomicrospira sp. R3]WFE68840.1 chemotaxis response regulator protein-glutamate methylesterase [Thiomicrospira sp. R3]